MAAVPIVGKFFKLAKVGKTMKEVPMIKTAMLLANQNGLMH